MDGLDECENEGLRIRKNSSTSQEIFEEKQEIKNGIWQIYNVVTCYNSTILWNIHSNSLIHNKAWNI